MHRPPRIHVQDCPRSTLLCHGHENFNLERIRILGTRVIFSQADHLFQISLQASLVMADPTALQN